MNEQIKKIILRLNQRDSLQSLSPQKVWDSELEEDIEALNTPNKHSDSRLITLLAGLHLRNDSIDIAHTYAQEVEHESTGAYWHGIIHRMEEDYSNSKYWFMRTGQHPVMNVVKQRTADWLKEEGDVSNLAQGRMRDTLMQFKDEAGWNASTFIDLIVWQNNSKEGTDVTQHILQHIQHIEVMVLFDYTLQEVKLN